MKKFKLVTAVLLALIMVVGMAACGGTTTPDSTPASTGGDSTPASTSEPAAEGGKSIVYWSMWDSTEAQAIAIQKAVDAYMADTGNTVTVEWRGRTGQREGLEPALDAGTTIDMFDEDIDRVNNMWGRHLMDLEALAAAADYEATANAGLIAACRAYDGTLKSIPYQPNVFAFFYNQDIFDEAGVTAVPTTWEEFVDACEKIKTAGYIPITSDDEYVQCLIGYYLGRLVGAEGVRDIVMNGTWDDPAVLEMATAYADLASNGYFSPTVAGNVWPAGQNTEMAMGSVGMYLNGSWLPNEVKDITGPDFNWGCFSFPSVPNGINGPEAANFGAQVYGINAASEVSQEAFDLICYITKGEYDEVLALESTGIPADSSNTEWPTMLSSVQPVMGQLETRWPWAVDIEANVDMTPAIRENAALLCAGQLTAEQYVEAMIAAAA